MTVFAEKFGIAFQIADDILDETADFEEIGKTPGKDKISGKLTYTSLYGMEKARKDLNLLLDECEKILQDNRLKSDIFSEILRKVRK